MDAVLTLIAGPGAALDAARAGTVREALVALGLDAAAPEWLAPGQACDLLFRGSPDQADAAARRALAGAAVDVVAQMLDGRRRRLLIADMESTIIRQEMLDELGELAGLRARISGITWRAMNGEIDFKESFRERMALLAGLPESALDQAAAGIELMPGARELVATMRAAGAWCMLVSGGFRRFTRLVAERCGFDAETGNEPEIADGRLTGGLLAPVLDADSKAEALVKTVVARRIPIRSALAVGDGANDLPMLEIAGLGVAFHARPGVVAAARARLDHADLTGLLYAQGYRQSEIVG